MNFNGIIIGFEIDEKVIPYIIDPIDMPLGRGPGEPKESGGSGEDGPREASKAVEEGFSRV